MKNQDIKKELKLAGVYQWQIADAMGIDEYKLSRKMRYELSEGDKNEIRKAIAIVKGAN